MGLLENWLLLAVLTPTFWAIGCLVDSCLISQNIYKTPIDGAVVSGLFCLVPTVLAFGFGIRPVSAGIDESGMPFAAIAAGLAYALHLYFYFRTLYCLNDVSGAETFLSMSVVLVPLFAWMILGEVLPAHYYVAFIIAATGVLLQCLPILKNVGAPVIVNMTISVIAVSLSMVLQSHALATHGFTISTVAFNFSCFMVAAAVMVVNKRVRDRIVVLFRCFPAVLIASEALGLLAVLASHRATQFGPSVSIVALIECLLPLIIIMISLLLITINRFAPLLPSDHQRTLAMQIQSLPSKMTALTLMIISLLSIIF